MIDYKLKARALAAELKRVLRALDAVTLRDAEARRQLRELQRQQIITHSSVRAALSWTPGGMVNLDELLVVLMAARAAVDQRGPMSCDLCDAPTIHNLRRAILAGRKK